MATKKTADNPTTVKVTVTREFLDKLVLKENGTKTYRKVGDVFEAEKARATELEKLGFVKAV